MGTASPVEVAWSLAAFVCTTMTASNCREAWRDWRVARALKLAPPAMIAAETELESQSSYLFVQAIFLLIGVGALLTPEPQVSAVSSFQDFAAGGLILCEVILAARSIRVRWRRRQLDVAILEAELTRKTGWEP